MATGDDHKTVPAPSHDRVASTDRVVVVGAGAAGLLAAIAAANEGAGTLVVDRRRKIGAKILISGGTRCNVTNEVVTERDFNTPSLPFVRNVLRRFPPEAVRELFERNGVALKLEPTGKYFPVSDSARDVLAGLLRAVEVSGAKILRERLVTGAARIDGGIRLVTDGEPIDACAVVLATGGLSYPATGSDGTGYAIARALGHTIVATSPALTPLVGTAPPFDGLAGVSLPARLRVDANGRRVVERSGSLLFTHTGFSGPVALDVSRHWIRESWEASSVELRASFAPDVEVDELEAMWLEAARRAPRTRAANWLARRLPNRLAEAIVAGSAPPDVVLGAATRLERRRIVEAVCDARLPVAGAVGFAKAEVTAGGVVLDEVVARTLESRLVPGLFFAGEILDVDGYIGGFNFQWAWSSGHLAGGSAAKYVSNSQGRTG